MVSCIPTNKSEEEILEREKKSKHVNGKERKDKQNKAENRNKKNVALVLPYRNHQCFMNLLINFRNILLSFAYLSLYLLRPLRFQRNEHLIASNVAYLVMLVFVYLKKKSPVYTLYII